MPIIQMIDKNLAPSRYQALKFGLWIGMASITMMFAALTSAYLVRRPAGNWYEFKLPIQFFVSTLIIIASSITMEWAYKNLKNQNQKNYNYGIVLTFGLGILFLVSQILSWKALVASGITIDLSVSGSFLYALSGIHAVHVIGGIAAIMVCVANAFLNSFTVSSMRLLKVDLVRQYWHFVDILWIYLLLFLILQ
ncbi:MAG: cytochrome c oxidase subunit 3 [Saprospiraceae bacterium]|jgi:cytochrome c oxidase subunit 3|nr:cytochrome c oxidase subunit 3 [Saprospiraceae bacterium]